MHFATVPCTTGPNSFDVRNHVLTVAEFRAWLGDGFNRPPLVDKKHGPAFLATHTARPVVHGKPAPFFSAPILTPGSRTDADAVAMSMLVHDIDTHATDSEVDAHVAATGRAAIRYRSFSSGKTQSTVAASVADNAGNPADAVRAHLESLGVDSRILDSIHDVRRVVSTKRVGGKPLAHAEWKFSHGPWLKHRVVWPAAELWPLDTPEKHAEWRALYLGSAAWLGLSIDEKTKNPARIFYCPAVRAGATRDDYTVRHFYGPLLQWSEIPRVEIVETIKRTTGTRRKRTPTRATHGDAEGGDVGSGYTWQTPGLHKWAKHARRFDFRAFCTAYKVPGYRLTRDGKASIPCPLAHEHSDGGAVDSGGFWLRNATDESGWFCACSHSSGPNHREGAQDRLKFLDALCVELGIADTRSLNRFVDKE
ncbi:MAG: hypothetical protein CTY28_09620 [Hyphomicrobium sp.]|nr:MAG: hypothetical protein CTY28_09620 [Hyphomicrobium sp.]